MKRSGKTFNSKRLTAIFLAASMLLTGNVSALAAADVSEEAAESVSETVEVQAAEDEVEVEAAAEDEQPAVEDAAPEAAEDGADDGGDISPAPGGDYPVDTEAASYLKGETITPKSYGADFSVKMGGEEYYSSTIYFFYTDKSDKDVFKGKSKLEDRPYYDETGVNYVSLYECNDLKEDYSSEIRVYSGTLAGNRYGHAEDSLKPDTTYKYRLAVTDDYGSTFRFITEQKTFKTLGAVTESKVSFKDVKIKSADYRNVVISFKVDNPDSEVIGYLGYLIEGSEEVNKFYSWDLDYDEETKNYNCRFSPEKEESVTLVAMVPLGADAALSQVKSEPLKLTVADYTKATLEATATPASASAVVDLKLTPSFKDSGMGGDVYYRKKGDSKYDTASFYIYDEVGESYTMIRDLEPETEYEYYADIYISGEENDRKAITFAGKDEPKSFKTTAARTFTAADFANEDVYKYLLKEYGSYDGKEADLTSKDLEQVDSFTLSNYELKSSGLKPLTSIKGFENMVNLNYLSLQGNDLSDISGVEKLVNLRSLNLAGNLLTDIPSLVGLKKLTSLDLDGNKLTKETLTEEKLPDRLLDVEDNKNFVAKTLADQLAEVKLVLPEKFYAIGSTWPFFVKADSSSYPRGGRNYYVSAEIDGKTIKTTEGNYESVWMIEDLAKAGVSMAAGTKNVKLTLFDEYDNNVATLETSVEFVADGLVVKTESYLIGEYDAQVKVDIPDITEKGEVTGAKVLDSKGAEVPLRTETYSSVNLRNNETRYDGFYVSSLKRNSAEVALHFYFETGTPMEAGDYDVTFTLGGKAYTAAGAIHVLKEGEGAVIYEAGLADSTEYDQNGDFVYVYVQGAGHYNASKVWPVLKNGETAYTEKYVEARVYDNYYGFIYKLPKSEAWKSVGTVNYLDLVLETSDEKYKVVDKRTAYERKIYFSNYQPPVLFDFYNYRTGYYTIDVARSLVPDGTKVSLKIEKQDGKGKYQTLVTDEAAVSGGKLRYELKLSDGKKFIPEIGEYYNFTCTFPDSIYSGDYSWSDNVYWYNFDITAYLKDTKTVYKAPLSTMDVRMVIKSELLNKDSENKVEVVVSSWYGEYKELARKEMTLDKWINTYKGEFTATIDFSKEPLTTGQYTVAVEVNGSDSMDSTSTFLVYDDANFYMQYQSAWFAADEKEGDSVRLNFEDPALAVDYATEKDGKKIWDERGYKLEVFKRTGNPSEPDKITWTDVTSSCTIKSVDEHYENSRDLYLNITGLERSEDGYWFRITKGDKVGQYIGSKNEKGEFYTYYSWRGYDDAHGMPGASYHESTSSSVTTDSLYFVEQENEEVGYGWFCGLRLESPVYPYTVFVYAPGSTSELAAINIKSGKKEKDSSYEYYYFTKSDLKNLSNNTVYDLVVVNSIGKLKDAATGYVDTKDSNGENNTEEETLPPVPSDVPVADDAPEMTASDKAEANAAYAKAIDEISKKANGDGEPAKASVEDTGLVVPNYKNGVTKSVLVESAKKSVKDFTVTVLAKSKIKLPGTAAYSITVGEASVSGNGVSGNGVSGNSAAPAGVKAPKAKQGKDGLTMIAPKAAKGVNEYMLTCVSSEYTVRLRVVNVAFDKNIKKAVLYTGAGEAGSGCGERLVVGVTPRKFINGTWSAGKQILNMGTNKVKCGKSFAFVYVMENGTAVVEPMTGASGSVKLTYTVSGKKFSTSVKASAKPLSSKQESARSAFKTSGLLQVPAAK